MALEVITLEDRKNHLLDRREIKTVLKNAAGKIKKIDAIEILAKQLSVEKKAIIPITFKCQTGKTDVSATFCIYNTEEEAKKQLPRYRLLRNIPKADRKKLIDEEKTAKLKAKQTSTVESKTSTRGKK